MFKNIKLSTIIALIGVAVLGFMIIMIMNVEPTIENINKVIDYEKISN